MSFFGIPMRNGLPLGLGTVASLTNGPGFLPSELYYNGIVQGAWYDPSDLTTLFQDSAGTTPVTAVEQAVGLMLDKSKGLVLGPELVTNGTFDTNLNGWTVGADPLQVIPTWSAGRVSLTRGTGGISGFSQELGLVSGRTYRVSFELVSGNVSCGGGLPGFTSVSTTGTNTRLIVANGTNIQFWPTSLSSTAVIDNVSVRELPGNHAYQTTSASRPTLRARYNLLTRSEEFNDAVWTKVGLNTTGTPAWVNVAVAPDGTTTADKLTEDTSTGTHRVQSAVVSASANTNYVFSIFVQAAERSFLQVNLSNVSFSGNVWDFDLVGLTATLSSVGSQWSNANGTITDAGNGWRRITVSGLTGASVTQLQTNILLSSASGVTSYTGNGTSGIFIWGAQLVPTAVFPSNVYQRVGAATDYATGAAFPPYLFFDGIDDSMLTNSVDFIGTDKMLVVAGVTKQSDAAFGCIAELTANAITTAGGFYLVAAGGAGSPGAFYGTAINGSSGYAADFQTFTAPITNVLTQQMDIAQPTGVTELTLRANGVAATRGTTSGTTAGTGNFANAPLYIGRRNNASLPFNGNIYSLIIAGQSYAASQISSTESWVAAKTPLGTI